MRHWLERVWYGEARGAAWLWPLAGLYDLVVRARRFAYREGLLRSGHPGRPVVVVGNLTVGGSGKTPLTAWLATVLAARGLKVGIASRGHGGSARGPVEVTPASDPRLVGDEPVLLARRSGARVVVARDRLAAARRLAPDVDLILADDGLQHYALRRDLEILVIDGRRRFGNGRLLPAGPLREPVARAGTVDLVVVNGGAARAGECTMTLVPDAVVALGSGERSALGDWRGRRVHAVAGIGDPARFFATLRAAGVEPIEHPLPDHAPIGARELAFGDGLPVLMTEKDAVKCGSLPAAGLAYVEVSARLGERDRQDILARVLALVGRA
jgi:tetraacyldisaccharide 4'-kinase